MTSYYCREHGQTFDDRMAFINHVLYVYHECFVITAS